MRKNRKVSLFKREKRVKAQMMMEVAALAAFIVAAILIMRLYIKRSLSGRFKLAMDELGADQYDPKKTKGSMTTKVTGVIDNTSKLKEYEDGAGNQIYDRMGNPVFGVETLTEFEQKIKRSGGEKLGVMGGDLFD
jgi:hypothetical protein